MEGKNSGRPAKRSSAADRAVPLICLLAAIYVLFEGLRVWLPRLHIDIEPLLSLRTVFLSILLESLPFLLIGIFVSSAISVLVPASLLERIFTRNRAFGFAAALFGGLLFPVCDCATVPVAARLIKKGVPPPVAVTFLLAAPIMNPIVILSTLYAFPGYPSVAVYRVALGLLVALSTGLAFSALPGACEATRLLRMEVCDDCCGENRWEEGPRLSGFEAVVLHAAGEFFEVGGYLIAGAAFSSVLQVFVPKTALTALAGNETWSLLVMMLAAFLLSICSTADAFIGRAFASAIPISSVMGFLVLGPMLDLKNILLLLGHFRKRFVCLLILVLIPLSFIVFLLLPKLLFRWWA